MTNHRETAKLLILTATDERTPEKERVAAMVQAVRLINEHDLLANPLDVLTGSNKTVRAATEVFSHLSSPGFVASMKEVVSALGSARKAATGSRSSGSGRTSRRR